MLLNGSKCSIAVRKSSESEGIVGSMVLLMVIIMSVLIFVNVEPAHRHEEEQIRTMDMQT